MHDQQPMGPEVDGVASSLATKRPCGSALYQATTTHRRQKTTAAASPRTGRTCSTVVTCVRRGLSTNQVPLSHPRACKGKRRAAYSRPPTTFTTPQPCAFPTTTNEGNRRAQLGAAGSVVQLRNHAAVGRGAGNAALSPASGTQPQFRQRLHQEQYRFVLQARATSDSSQHVTAMGSTMSKGQNHITEGAKASHPLSVTPTKASAEPAAISSGRTSKIRRRATTLNPKSSSRRAKRAVSSRATCPPATSAAPASLTPVSAQRKSCRMDSTGTAKAALATKLVLKQTVAQRRRAVMPTAASRRPPRAAALVAAARLRHEQERAHSSSGSFSESEQVDQDACGSIRRRRSSSSQLGGSHTGKLSVGSGSTGRGSSGGGFGAEGKQSVAEYGSRGVNERRVSLEDVWNALGAEYFQDPHVVQVRALTVESRFVSVKKGIFWGC